MTFEFFDRVYCIHLPNPERRKAIGLEFDRVGIKDVTYIHAEPPDGKFTMSNMRRNPPAEFGVNLSHFKAVVQALEDGAQRPLFVEDDIVFSGQCLETLAKSLADLPYDWDVLYLGGHPREPVQAVSPSLVKVGTFSFAEAYAIRRPALGRFATFWVDRIGAPRAMYDFILGEFAAQNNGYCVWPLVTEQPPGFSQIGNCRDDKRLLVERGWKANSSIK